MPIQPKSQWSPPIYLTSRLYPLLENENLQAGIVKMLVAPAYEWREAIGAENPAMVSGTLMMQLVTYDNYPPENLQAGQVEMVSGTLMVQLVEYNNYPPENLQAGQVSMVSGSLQVQLIEYNNYPPENLQAGQVAMVSGALV